MTKNRILVASLLLAALTSPAMAQRGDCGPMRTDPFSAQPDSPQKQKQVHDALKLAPEQETAWKKFAESHPAGGAGKAVDWASLSAPERAEQRLDALKREEQRLSEYVAAMKAFYAVLNPEQKKTFDQFHGGARTSKGG